MDAGRREWKCRVQQRAADHLRQERWRQANRFKLGVLPNNNNRTITMELEPFKISKFHSLKPWFIFL